MDIRSFIDIVEGRAEQYYCWISDNEAIEALKNDSFAPKEKSTTLSGDHGETVFVVPASRFDDVMNDLGRNLAWIGTNSDTVSELADHLGIQFTDL